MAGTRQAAFSLSLLLLGISACYPIYRNYALCSAPPSDAGHECVRACDGMQEHCLKTAERELEQCQFGANLDRKLCESMYLSQTGKNAPSWACVQRRCAFDSSTCDDQYAWCYNRCGGSFGFEQRCISNCE